jgi:hypothetical protein
MTRPPITAEQARELLDYDPLSGWLRWKVDVRYGVPAGTRAGTAFGSDGYRSVVVRRKTCREHRLIWLIVTGAWPTEEIDHRDRDRQNNQWANLRDLPKAKNQQNTPRCRVTSASGRAGVSFQKANKKWTAYITKDKKRMFLGIFERHQDAVSARDSAEAKLFEYSPLWGSECR